MKNTKKSLSQEIKMIKNVLRNIRHMFMNQSSDVVIALMILSAS